MTTTLTTSQYTPPVNGVTNHMTIDSGLQAPMGPAMATGRGQAGGHDRHQIWPTQGTSDKIGAVTAGLAQAQGQKQVPIAPQANTRPASLGEAACYLPQLQVSFAGPGLPSSWGGWRSQAPPPAATLRKHLRLPSLPCLLWALPSPRRAGPAVFSLRRVM